MRGAQRRRVTAARLAGACLLVLGLTACDGWDLSALFGFEPPAAPDTTIEHYDISNSPSYNRAQFISSEWDRASIMASEEIAATAQAIAALANDSVHIKVRLEGHADMRCGESVWYAKHDGPNYNNPPTNKWCSPRDANDVTPQGIWIGQERADTIAGVLDEKVRALGVDTNVKVAWEAVGKGEFGHEANETRCRRFPDIDPCLRDRRVDVFVSSRTCDSSTCGSPITAPPRPEGCGGPNYCMDITFDCLDRGDCLNDPKPTLDPVRGSATAFSYAQQNTDQSIKFALGGLTCNGGTPAPCGVPTSGEMRTGTAGPYLVSSRLSSFVLNAPSGYRSPAQYRIITDPTGASLGSGATAKLRFYAATRSNAPYSYTATAEVTVQWNTWEWDGDSMYVTGSSTETVPVTLTCTPAKTPTCSFGVLSSNVSR